MKVRMSHTAYMIMDGSERMYLVPDWMREAQVKRWATLVEADPTREFYGFVAEQVNAVLAGEKVPEEIEPVLLNLVDDKMNNRKMGLRTGDYVVLQQFFRDNYQQAS